MIYQNELFDISFTLSLIRGDIENCRNIAVAERLTELLKEEVIGDNRVRRALRSVTDGNEKWEFVNRENYYVKTVVLDIDRNKFIGYLEHLKRLLADSRFEEALCFADALHVLPDMMAANKGRIPKGFYRVYLRPYNRNWKRKLR